MVVFAGEQRPGFQLGQVIFRVAELAVEFLQQIIALRGVRLFLREMDVGLEFAVELGQFVVSRRLIFRALAVAENALRGFLIVPEIGLRDARFEGLQALAMLRRVKDNSEPAQCAAGEVRSGAASLPESYCEA